MQIYSFPNAIFRSLPIFAVGYIIDSKRYFVVLGLNNFTNRSLALLPKTVDL